MSLANIPKMLRRLLSLSLSSTFEWLVTKVLILENSGKHTPRVAFFLSHPLINNTVQIGVIIIIITQQPAH